MQTEILCCAFPRPLTTTCLPCTGLPSRSCKRVDSHQFVHRHIASAQIPTPWCPHARVFCSLHRPDISSTRQVDRNWTLRPADLPARAHLYWPRSPLALPWACHTRGRLRLAAPEGEPKRQGAAAGGSCRWPGPVWGRCATCDPRAPPRVRGSSAKAKGSPPATFSTRHRRLLVRSGSGRPGRHPGGLSPTPTLHPPCASQHSSSSAHQATVLHPIYYCCTWRFLQSRGSGEPDCLIRCICCPTRITGATLSV